MKAPIIETDHLILRGFTPVDIDRLAEILSDSMVMRYMPGGKPLSRRRVEAALRGIIGHWDKHGYGRWAVTCKVDDRVLGWCGLEFLKEIDETEVAYLLDSSYWGRGFATEATHASLRYGFEELKLERIIALAVPENSASLRVMEKMGMVFARMVHLWNLDLVQYAITRDEFRAREIGPVNCSL